MDNDFDKNLTEFLKNEAAIATTKNIGEAAISKVIKIKESEAMIKNRIHKLKPTPLKYVAVVACMVVVIAGGTIAASAQVRNSLYELIQSIFIIEKDGDSYVAAEKNADEVIISDNWGGVSIDQFSSNELNDKLGFKPFTPEVVGSNSKHYASVGINLIGKPSDLIPFYNNPDEAVKCIKDDSVFKKMKKFDPLRHIMLFYSTNGNIKDETQMVLKMSKKVSTRPTLQKLVPINDFDYKGIKCSYSDVISLDYQKERIKGWTCEDFTKNPNGVLYEKTITFNLDGVHYSTYAYKRNSDNSSANKYDYDVNVQFVKDYIDKYMSK